MPDFTNLYHNFSLNPIKRFFVIDKTTIQVTIQTRHSQVSVLGVNNEIMIVISMYVIQLHNFGQFALYKLCISQAEIKFISYNLFFIGMATDCRIAIWLIAILSN